MTLSVILCTYNRCQSLAKTLASLAGSVVPASVQWEVLVVDNNSRDGTRAVAEAFAQQWPGRCRYVFEPTPGKSFALNRALREARGDVLVFTDDDVTMEPTWLHHLTRPLVDEAWAGTGGRTLPTPPFSAPPWLGLTEPYNLGGVVAALFDLGDQAQELARAPYGANMAFRKTMFQKYGGFRTDLGPRPGTEMRNEDTEFGRRLLAGGERLRYEPTAVVYHPVFVERLRQDYFLDWYIAFGRAAVREWGLEGTRLGLPRRFLTLLRLLAAVLPRRILIWLVDYDPRRRFHHKCWVWMTWGHIREVWQDLRGPAAGHRSHGTTGGQGDPGAASGSIQLTATPGLADKPNPPS